MSELSVNTVPKSVAWKYELLILVREIFIYKTFSELFADAWNESECCIKVCDIRYRSIPIYILFDIRANQFYYILLYLFLLF
jgi:hypothetical protein